MIEEIDACFDEVEADENVRVVILAAEGKHFSAGHDLKEILAGEEHWAALRATPEGKLSTSRSCTGTSSCGSATSRRSRSPRCRAAARPPA